MNNLEHRKIKLSTTLIDELGYGKRYTTLRDPWANKASEATSDKRGQMDTIIALLHTVGDYYTLANSKILKDKASYNIIKSMNDKVYDDFIKKSRHPNMGRKLKGYLRDGDTSISTKLPSLIQQTSIFENNDWNYQFVDYNFLKTLISKGVQKENLDKNTKHIKEELKEAILFKTKRSKLAILKEIVEHIGNVDNFDLLRDYLEKDASLLPMKAKEIRKTQEEIIEYLIDLNQEWVLKLSHRELFLILQSLKYGSGIPFKRLNSLSIFNKIIDDIGNIQKMLPFLGEAKTKLNFKKGIFKNGVHDENTKDLVLFDYIFGDKKDILDIKLNDNEKSQLDNGSMYDKNDEDIKEFIIESRKYVLEELKTKKYIYQHHIKKYIVDIHVNIYNNEYISLLEQF